MKGTTDRRACPPRLVERGAQWSRLTRLLTDAGGGYGRVALVTGPVAAGKTELLHAFAEFAAAPGPHGPDGPSGPGGPHRPPEPDGAGDGTEERGALVSTVVCSASECALPFGVASRLLRTPALYAGDATDRLLEQARHVAGEQGESGGPDGGFDAGTPAAARVLDALCGTVLAAAGTRTVLIGVEDVRHVDAPSMHWLLYLVRRLGPARVLLVLTDIPAPRTGCSPLHTELLRHPYCRTVEVPLLTERGVAACVAAHAGGRDGGAGDAVAADEAAAGEAADGGAAADQGAGDEGALDAGAADDSAADEGAEILRAGGGNPLLVRALLEDRRSGVRDGGVGRGPDFQKALLSCMERCEAAAPAVMRALCVLDGPARTDALARLTGSDTATVAEALSRLEETGLLYDGGLRHPAVRTAVLESLSSGERSRLHLAAAALLHGEGAPADRIAPHLLTAGHLEDASLLPVLHEAAEHALRAERPRTAVSCLELVRDACTDARSRTAAEVKLVSAESRVNPAAAARRLPELAAALREDTVTARDATALVGPLLRHGRTDDAAAALRRARGAGREPHAREAAELRAVEMWLACTHPRLAHRESPVPALSPAGAHGPSVRPLLTSATALAQVLGQGATDDAVADAEHVLQAARPSDTTVWGVEPALLALYALLYADRLEIAQPWCERLLEESRAAGATVAQAHFAAARAEIALRCGELPAAYEHASGALALLPVPAWGVLVGLPLGTLVLAATGMGRHDDAAAHLRQPVPDAMFHTRYGLHYLHARGRHYLAADRHYAAAADFLSCRELMTQWGVDMPGLVPWRTCTAETWLRQAGGDRDEARRLVNEQLAKLGPGPSRTRGVALRLLAGLSSPHNRLQLLAESVAILEERGDQWELARALADLSAAHRELRAHRRAWTVARRGWHVADACGAAELCDELLPSRSRLEVADSGRARAETLGALTDAERRVAALAAAGHTNREIAAKLCITPSTIEQHLTRVYRKLKVKYRRDLPSELQTYLPDTA
ncbi:helix-turn-helix transcriptional regulator [Streptomyces sp. HNM0575]|uniref:helix-turn-helix transcriptional regulator n=1 Tax=Streptomyces sp. HNM0575 TaxID=2716338 RepID=UPI00145C7A3B|nr:LuxR C-terminal-related transcriptional regulator [Streptomyces sp. HNM0575]NLU76609.1 helix-turn-helix transcriptional regulator [Streptomyces sp. HNM0575]